MNELSAVQTFVEYANTLDGDEKSEAQVFLDRLFIAFGHKGHKEAGAKLEQRIRKTNGKTSFADLRWKDRCLIEMKKRGENLRKHYPQAFEYWINSVPSRPRYVVMCNFDEFWVYDLNLQISEPVDRMTLAEMPSRYEALNFLFPDVRPPLFGNNRVAVTRAAADKVAQVFRSLIGRGIVRSDAQRFVLQAVAAMFSEDIGLLPKHVFTHIIDECEHGASSYDLVGGLFRQMNEQKPASGGRYVGVPYFNGGLFSSVDPIDLNPYEISLIKEATSENWAKVEPPIFGSLFQNSMDAEERHAYGAHFTSEADIQRVVLPTIVTPWRERIAAAKTLDDLQQLRIALSQFRVLDPACGSGNFLYIAYREMKHLEMDLLQRAHEKFATGFKKVKTGAAVHVQQFFGLDITPFAVELAKVTLTMGKKLAIDDARQALEATQIDLDLEHEFERALPLDNLDSNIQCRDALLTPWPPADAIIGNPPYQSKNKMQPVFGPSYVQRIRSKFPEIPGRADYCVYWFRKAHDELAEGARAGLVGTNTIRQNYSREGGLDYIVDNGGTITEAVSTQEWSGDAAVSVSIVNWIKGSQKGLKRLRTQHVQLPDQPWEYVDLPAINSSLSDAVDVTTAEVLAVNSRAPVCFQGQTHGHKGFLLTPDAAAKMISARAKNVEVVLPFLGAKKLFESKLPGRDRYVIDFHPRSVTEAAVYVEPFAQVKESVLPARKKAALKETNRNEAVLDANPNARVNLHHQNFLNHWWLMSYCREDLILKIEDLSRYIVCSRVTKRPIFDFVSSAIRPNDSLMVFALADDYSFGIIQSIHHWKWFVAKCSTLTERFRYTSNTVFDTFPWPQSPTVKSVQLVVDKARELRAVRRKILAENKWSLRELYASLESPGSHPLRDAHNGLNDAVNAVYGMTTGTDPLAFLLKLNLKLADAENQKKKVIGPGLDALGTQFASKAKTFTSSDCIAV